MPARGTGTRGEIALRSLSGTLQPHLHSSPLQGGLLQLRRRRLQSGDVLDQIQYRRGFRKGLLDSLVGLKEVEVLACYSQYEGNF